MRMTACLLAAALALPTLAFTAPARADDVKVENAWMRATVPGQKVAGGFMDLTAGQNMQLVGASSPVAQSVELHYMRMADGVMEMRELDSIRLPKGETVQLAPGGYHAMFIGIKAAIKAGDKVPMTLTFADAQGRRGVQQISLRVTARRD